MAHHQFENHQRVGGGGGTARILVLAPDSLTVSLQGQEGVAEVVPAIALLDKQLFPLGLKNEERRGSTERGRDRLTSYSMFVV